MKYLITLLALISILFTAQPAQASIARVQETHASDISSTASATFSGASVAGNLLVAVVVVGASTTSSPPTSFSSAISNTSATNAPVYMFYRAGAPATTTISATLSGSIHWIMFIAEYSGVIQNLPVDQTGTNTTASGNASTGNIVTGRASEAAVGAIGTLTGDTYTTATNGFTIVDTSTNAFVGGAYLDKITTTTGTYGTTTNNASGGNGIIAGFPANEDNGIWMSLPR